MTSGGGPPLHVALLRVGGRRVFARLDQAPRDEAEPEEILAGSTVKLLVKDDGDQYFQIPSGRSLDLGALVQSIRRRVGACSAARGLVANRSLPSDHAASMSRAR